MSKSHVTREGLLTLVSLKASLNRGLSETLNIAFPEITSVLRPEVKLSGIIDPFWFTGFVDAEGCFSVVLFKSKTSKLGEATKLSFILTQNVRDINLMRSFVEYFKCGYVASENINTVDFKITKLTELKNVIVPFFEKYPLQSKKSLDFQAFLEVVKLVDSKQHLTLEGLNKIRVIKNGMNNYRK
jgi:hypothetical protein